MLECGEERVVYGRSDVCRARQLRGGGSLSPRLSEARLRLWVSRHMESSSREAGE